MTLHSLWGLGLGARLPLSSQSKRVGSGDETIAYLYRVPDAAAGTRRSSRSLCKERARQKNACTTRFPSTVAIVARLYGVSFDRAEELFPCLCVLLGLS